MSTTPNHPQGVTFNDSLPNQILTKQEIYDLANAVLKELNKDNPNDNATVDDIVRFIWKIIGMTDAANITEQDDTKYVYILNVAKSLNPGIHNKLATFMERLKSVPNAKRQRDRVVGQLELEESEVEFVNLQTGMSVHDKFHEHLDIGTKIKYEMYATLRRIFMTMNSKFMTKYDTGKDLNIAASIVDCIVHSACVVYTFKNQLKSMGEKYKLSKHYREVISESGPYRFEIQSSTFYQVLFFLEQSYPTRQDTDCMNIANRILTPNWKEKVSYVDSFETFFTTCFENEQDYYEFVIAVCGIDEKSIKDHVRRKYEMFKSDLLQQYLEGLQLCRIVKNHKFVAMRDNANKQLVDFIVPQNNRDVTIKNEVSAYLCV